MGVVSWMRERVREMQEQASEIEGQDVHVTLALRFDDGQVFEVGSPFVVGVQPKSTTERVEVRDD